MARIFVGNSSRISGEVVQTISGLSDAFTALLEVDVDGRNIDAWLMGTAGAGPTIQIVAEFKNTLKPFRGTENGEWTVLGETGLWEPLPGRTKDANPYRQAVAAANTAQNWLFNNRKVYSNNLDDTTAQHFRVWPDLVVTSPAPLRHELPGAPANRYGRWFLTLQDWVDHVAQWQPRPDAASLSQGQILTIADLLNLRPLAPLQAPAAACGEPAPAELHRWLSTLDVRLRGLDDRLARLERR